MHKYCPKVALSLLFWKFDVGIHFAVGNHLRKKLTKLLRKMSKTDTCIAVISRLGTKYLTANSFILFEKKKKQTQKSSTLGCRANRRKKNVFDHLFLSAKLSISFYFISTAADHEWWRMTYKNNRIRQLCAKKKYAPQSVAKYRLKPKEGDVDCLVGLERSRALLVSTLW